MNICSGDYSNSHDEICYEGRICPLCEKIKELEEAYKQVESLKDDLRQYE